MAPSIRFVLVALASTSLVQVVAQPSTTVSFPASGSALDQLSFPHPTDAPYQIYGPNDPIQYSRGPQTGYNRCNSTTEGQNSLCQTMYVNGLDDFCLWGPPQPNTTISDSEGLEVAWCSKKGYGTRLMESGLIQSAQLLKTSEYIMITGTINQPLINMPVGDYGGELDSGGQDTRGNPIGGLIYSKAFSTDGQPNQIVHWTEFIGGNQFCIKICNNNGKNPVGYCQHTLDRIGMAYNCPSKFSLGGTQVPNGQFEVCDSDLMTIPGEYVENGQTKSYSQPDGTAAPTPPYTAQLVSSSNCVTSASSALFATGAPATQATASATATAGASAITGTNVPPGSRGASNPTPTGSSSGAARSAPLLSFSVIAVVMASIGLMA